MGFVHHDKKWIQIQWDLIQMDDLMGLIQWDWIQMDDLMGFVQWDLIGIGFRWMI